MIPLSLWFSFVVVVVVVFSPTISMAIEERIVGGERVQIDRVPWQVVIHQTMPDGSIMQCGAVLIAPQWILTASHCVLPTITDHPIDAYFGVSELSQLNSKAQSAMIRTWTNRRRHLMYKYIQSVRFFYFPYYQRSKARKTNPTCSESTVATRSVVQFVNSHDDADLALLKLNESVVFNEQIQAIDLPEEGEDFVYKIATVSGFGATQYNKNLLNRPTSQLHSVQVPILSKSACVHLYANAFEDGPKAASFVENRNILCAGLMEGGRDACIGDSGGPLAVCVDTPPLEFVRSNSQCSGRWKLAGIVSVGYRCAEPGIPGLYTDISVYANFIRQLIT